MEVTFTHCLFVAVYANPGYTVGHWPVLKKSSHRDARAGFELYDAASPIASSQAHARDSVREGSSGSFSFQLYTSLRKNTNTPPEWVRSLNEFCQRNNTLQEMVWRSNTLGPRNAAIHVESVHCEHSSFLKQYFALTRHSLYYSQWDRVRKG